MIRPIGVPPFSHPMRLLRRRSCLFDGNLSYLKVDLLPPQEAIHCARLHSIAMSLFGEDPPASRSKSSLFDDGDTAPLKGTSSSMFGEGPAETTDSPWDFTPKKSTGRGDLVKSLLADADVPDLYIDTFDRLQTGSTVPSADCQQLLKESGLSTGDERKIWNIVSNHGETSTLGRGEFNVLLALVGLAQEGDDLSLDAVDERRRKLPSPSLQTAKPQPSSTPPVAHSQAGAKATPRNGSMRPSGYGASYGESDPWASPEMHKGHEHSNGVKNVAPQRTTSSFTTSATDHADITESGSFGTEQTSGTTEAGSWGTGSFGAPSGASYGPAGAPDEGFGDAGGNGSSAPRRPNPPRIATSKGVEELVTVNLLDEKEGMFMFQHRNYEVASVRRNSKVIRRYSDFVWLLDCLHKRYPFRQLPLLPPKRVAINGNHIAADTTFLEKRRRGLVRFSNALVRHPILREEQLVVMFLTVPTVDAGLSASIATIMTDRIHRNWPYGENKPPSVCKRSLWERACHPHLRTAYRRNCRTRLILCVLGFAGQRNFTSPCAILSSGCASARKPSRPSMDDSV